MAFSLRLHAYSETGLVRHNNQDSVYASPTLLVVADGMGGAAAGDLASAVVIKRLRETDGHFEGEAMLHALSEALSRANDDVADLIAADPTLDGMGTTVCGALFSGTQLGVVHIGDSRGYLLRAGHLTQITHDHSWVQSLIDDGELTPEEAAVHPKRSLLLKVLNGQPVHAPDLSLLDVQAGDRVMFCSDGLSGLITPETLSRLLRTADAEEAVRRLVGAARKAGGYDNITLVVADVVAPDPALDSAAPRILGAAAQVRVPVVPSSGGAAALMMAQPEAEAAGRQAVANDGWWLEGGTEEPAARIVRPGGRARRRGPRWVAPLVWTVVTLAVLAGAVFGARAWLDRQYYLGESADVVAIYQGAPERIAWIVLARPVQITTTRLDDLPSYYAEQVRQTQIRPGSLEAAQQAAAQLEEKAQICIAWRAEQAQRPSPTSSAPVGPGGPLASPPASGSLVTPTATLAPASDPEACS